MFGGAPRERMGGILEDFDENHPDARLIAAAPDLLESLRKFVDGHFTYFGDKVIGSDSRITKDDIARARAAIAKALGESA